MLFVCLLACFFLSSKYLASRVERSLRPHRLCRKLTVDWLVGLTMSKMRWVSNVCTFTWKKPDWKGCLLPSHTSIQKSHQLWLCSRPVPTYLHPTPLCSSVSWWGTQRRTTLSYTRWWRRIRIKLPDERFKLSFSSVCVIHGSSLIRYFNLATLSFGSNGQRTTTTVAVFKRRFTELSFLVPVMNCRSRRTLAPKAVCQTLEALLVSS